MFILQTVLGFLGTLAYGTVIFFLLIFTSLRPGVPEIIPTLIFFIGVGIGLGIAIITVYFRWFGVLAGIALAILMPLLLVGACIATLFGISTLGNVLGGGLLPVERVLGV